MNTTIVSSSAVSSTVEHLSNLGMQMAKDGLSIENIDNSQFDDMGQFNDTDLLVYIRDRGESDMPSIKYGMWFQVTIYVGLVFAACACVAFIIYFSKRQEEKNKTKWEEKTTEQTVCHRRSTLQCRPWSQKLLEDQSATFNMNNDFSIRTGRMGESTDESSDSDIEEGSSPDCLAIPPAPECDELDCKLCSGSFELGEPVYESNNPQCKHIFHMVCMDKWLNVQNTCPVCNHAYVLQQSGETA